MMVKAWSVKFYTPTEDVPQPFWATCLYFQFQFTVIMEDLLAASCFSGLIFSSCVPLTSLFLFLTKVGDDSSKTVLLHLPVLGYRVSLLQVEECAYHCWTTWELWISSPAYQDPIEWDNPTSWCIKHWSHIGAICQQTEVALHPTTQACNTNVK